MPCVKRPSSSLSRLKNKQNTKPKDIYSMLIVSDPLFFLFSFLSLT